LLEVYHRELLRRDLSGGFHRSLSWVERTKSVSLGDEYVMAEVEAPPHFGGKTLRELNVRANYSVEVILVRKSKQKTSRATIVPPPDYRIEHGDILLLMGKQEKVKDLMA
jgi:trk system potassium uptake protein TrkA